MGIIEQYMIISFILAMIFVTLIGQSVLISRIHKTAPWTLFAIGWFLIGARQVYAMVKVPLALEQMRARGIPIDPISIEGWLMVGSGAMAGIVFIVGHDILRRYYQRVGV